MDLVYSLYGPLTVNTLIVNLESVKNCIASPTSILIIIKFKFIQNSPATDLSTLWRWVLSVYASEPHPNSKAFQCLHLDWKYFVALSSSASGLRRDKTKICIEPIWWQTRWRRLPPFWLWWEISEKSRKQTREIQNRKSKKLSVLCTRLYNPFCLLVGRTQLFRH